jgi:hypothetical protein
VGNFNYVLTYVKEHGRPEQNGLSYVSSSEFGHGSIINLPAAAPIIGYWWSLFKMK